MQVFRCPENCSRGKLPPGQVKVWFRISVRIRAGGQFSLGAIFLEPSFSKKCLLYAFVNVATFDYCLSYAILPKSVTSFSVLFHECYYSSFPTRDRFSLRQFIIQRKNREERKKLWEFTRLQELLPLVNGNYFQAPHSYVWKSLEG